METIIRRIGYYEYRKKKYNSLKDAYWVKLLIDRGLLKNGFEDFY